jgi:hypothetical protein
MSLKASHGLDGKDLLQSALKSGKGLQANPFAVKAGLNGAAALQGGKAGAGGLGLLAKALGLVGGLAAAGVAAWKVKQSVVLAGAGDKLKKQPGDVVFKLGSDHYFTASLVLLPLPLGEGRGEGQRRFMGHGGWPPSLPSPRGGRSKGAEMGRTK